MKGCKTCGSYAINPKAHGRDPGVDLDLCDVCYWRKRAPAWQSIETAPKGRKLIVGYHNTHGNWRTIMATYYLPQTLLMEDDCDDLCYADGYAPEGWYEECESQDTIRRPDAPPTYWMNLPMAPK